MRYKTMTVAVLSAIGSRTSDRAFSAVSLICGQQAGFNAFMAKWRK